MEDYLSIPFCADEATIEAIFALLLQSISSVFTEQSQICYAAMEPSESMVAYDDLLNTQRPLPMNEDEEQLINLCTDAGFVKTVVTGQCFLTKDADLHVDEQGHRVVANSTIGVVTLQCSSSTDMICTDMIESIE